MKIILLLLGVATAGLYRGREKLGVKLTGIMAGILALVTGVACWFHFTHPPPKPGVPSYNKTDVQEPVRQFVHAVAAVVTGGGNVLVIVPPFQSEHLLPMVKLQVAAAREALAETNLKLVGVEPQMPDAESWPLSPSIPRASMEAYLQKYPGLVAVLSLYGVPAARRDALPPQCPTIFVLDRTNPGQAGSWETE